MAVSIALVSFGAFSFSRASKKKSNIIEGVRVKLIELGPSIAGAVEIVKSAPDASMRDLREQRVAEMVRYLDKTEDLNRHLKDIQKEVNRLKTLVGIE